MGVQLVMKKDWCIGLNENFDSIFAIVMKKCWMKRLKLIILKALFLNHESRIESMRVMHNSIPSVNIGVKT